MKESGCQRKAVPIFLCSCLGLILGYWVNKLLLYTCLPYGFVGLSWVRFVSVLDVFVDGRPPYNKLAP
jgi:hypothetical protein